MRILFLVFAILGMTACASTNQQYTVKLQCTDTESVEVPSKVNGNIVFIHATDAAKAAGVCGVNVARDQLGQMINSVGERIRQ